MSGPGDALLEIHDEIDERVRGIAARHVGRLQCRMGCHGCCVDELTVFEVEAERIRRNHPSLLCSGEPHTAGACAFLGDDGACRIYDDRPYVCRTQGLPLRWIDDGEDDGPVEMRDICPLNEVDREPIEALPGEHCWTLGPYESRLAVLQSERGIPPRRIRLRDLFRRHRGGC